jgi:hypothetical protein
MILHYQYFFLLLSNILILRNIIMLVLLQEKACGLINYWCLAEATMVEIMTALKSQHSEFVHNKIIPTMETGE